MNLPDIATEKFFAFSAIYCILSFRSRTSVPDIIASQSVIVNAKYGVISEKMPVISESSLTPDHIGDLRPAASEMRGAERRAFIAEMTLKYCNGNKRKAEVVSGWGRKTIGAGPGEKHTGIICIGAQSVRSGRIRWEKKEPEACAELRRIAEARSQQDPTFRSTAAYTGLTAEAALKFLREKGSADEQLPSGSSMAAILNRMGYRLRKAVKAEPLKKIKQTDAVFENIKEKDQQIKKKECETVKYGL